MGFTCSSFDWYMACCLATCVEITIIGPDGTTVSAGSISASDECAPCPSPCETSELSIGYTTQQMLEGECQGLWAHDSECGDGVGCCDENDIHWSLEGGGTLAKETGHTNTYCAPSDNSWCLLNPTITIEDCCGRSASVTLAVTRDNLYTAYALKGTCTVTRMFGLCNCYCGGYWPLADDRYSLYYCDGTFYGKSPSISCGGPDWGCEAEESGVPCETDACPWVIDLRTEAMKEEACCPVALI